MSDQARLKRAIRNARIVLVSVQGSEFYIPVRKVDALELAAFHSWQMETDIRDDHLYLEVGDE